jgi:hypothetical protein
VRIIAIDWSGASVGAARRIWLAEACAPERLERLECGRDRAALAHYLLDLVHTERRIVIGLDFAFSFPSWYLDVLGISDAPALWAQVADHGDRWLRDCAPPLWGRRGRPRPSLEEHFRRTEHTVRARRWAVKSVFQIGGAGAVGTGSIRGMPMLHRLRAAGAAIWPFDRPGWPLVVEIYPRMLTGKIVKSRCTERERYLTRYDALEPDQRTLAAASDDAFDAAVSALVMARHADDLASLPEESDAHLRREGRIWYPEWRADVT